MYFFWKFIYIIIVHPWVLKVVVRQKKYEILVNLKNPSYTWQKKHEPDFNTYSVSFKIFQIFYFFGLLVKMCQIFILFTSPSQKVSYFKDRVKSPSSGEFSTKGQGRVRTRSVKVQKAQLSFFLVGWQLFLAFYLAVWKLRQK